MKYFAFFAFALLLALAPALALPPNVVGPLLSTGGAIPVSIIFQGNDSNTTGSFVGKPIGTAAPGRVVGVGLVYQVGSSGSVTSMTVGGITATRRQRATLAGGGGNNLAADIWTATVPTGTTANITLSFSGSSFFAIANYSIYNAGSETPTNGANATASGTSSIAATLTVLPKGVGVGVALCNAGSASLISWTNLTQNTSLNWITNAVLGAGSIASPGTGARTSTCDRSGNQMLSVAAWGP